MLEGKVAYVTGSSRGIGAAVAETFASYGASVVINGHSDPDALSAAAARMSASYDVRVEAVSADQRDPEQISSCYRYIFETFKRLDILVNNAGVLDDAFLGMISEESLERTFQINALAIARNMQDATRLLQRAGSGSIVNVSSIVGANGNAGQVVYGGSKAAVIGMTRSAAKELAPKQIRVNAIAPGLIDTDMIKSMPIAKYEQRLASIGMGRIGTPQDVANVALFLASDLASYVTGQVIGVDGSMLI
jgi:3-oxoacyl-[acyl-carrier protein] reductase